MSSRDARRRNCEADDCLRAVRRKLRLVLELTVGVRAACAELRPRCGPRRFVYVPIYRQRIVGIGLALFMRFHIVEELTLAPGCPNMNESSNKYSSGDFNIS